LDYSTGIKFLKDTDVVFRKLHEDLGFLEQRKRSVSYASFVSTIVGQQLSGKAADTIYGRLLVKVENQVIPEKIFGLQISELRELGISNAKSQYIKNLAKKFLDGQIKFDQLNSASDEDLYKDLIAIKGIGPWSARIIMLFNFQRLDAFPFGDVTLEKAFCILWKTEIAELPTFVKSWTPVSGIVAMYMWSFIDKKIA
jgi:DNA-3-methyladenine glycosylase II